MKISDLLDKKKQKKNTVPINLWIEEPLALQLAELANRQSLSMSALLRKALGEYIKNNL